MKTCIKCNAEKELEEFPQRYSTRKNTCKECVKAYSKTHYENNKQDYYRRNSRRNNTNLQYIRDYKLSHPCACGESHPACLDFHHIDPSTKTRLVSECTTYNIATIIAEINKCVILCANCHRKLHYNETHAGESGFEPTDLFINSEIEVSHPY